MKGRNSHPVRFAHFAMGTTFELIASVEDEAYAGQAGLALFAEIDRLESLLSRFDPGSEVSQISRLKPGESMRTGIEVYECLDIARQISHSTRGAFSIFMNGEGRLPASPMGDNPFFPLALSRGTEGPAAVWKEGTPSHKQIDLGGLGKGYALDKCLEILHDWGIERALIHGGTSTVLALGTPPGREKRGWPVGIGGLWEGTPKTFHLQNAALSGSGTEVKGGHIFDPRTGETAAGHLAAWVAHPSAAVADALSTAFMVMSEEEVADYCGQYPEVWAMVVNGEKKFKIFQDGHAIINNR
jgi:thiamine biosynthesis lipoprotein